MPQKVHTNHGRDHRPGGADPIPGLTVAAPSFPTVVGDLAATRDLRGYWRLGEGASPFADTSGHPDGPAPASKQTSTTPMSEDVSGALPADDDDGAVQFNAFTASDLLHAPEPSLPRFDFALGDEPMSVAAWIRPVAGSTTYPTTAVGSWLNHGTFGNCGWRVGANFPALTPFFQRRQASGTPLEAVLTGSPMVADSWYFVVGTYDGINGHRLYVNGTVAATDTDTFTNLPTFGQGVWFGYGIGSGTTPNHFRGRLDEVTVWGDALSAAEIARLYEAGAGTTGGAGGGHTIADEGIGLTTRNTLDFIGAGVTATDDAANNKTKVTIPGANPAADVPTGGTAGQVLTKDTTTDYDTSWQAPAGGRPPLVTTLPPAPVDGQEIYYVADATNGIIWHLRYRAASPHPYKWETVAAMPMQAVVLTTGTRADAAQGHASDVQGPGIFAPLSGQYMIGWGGHIQLMSAAGATEGFIYLWYDLAGVGLTGLSVSVIPTGQYGGGSCSTFVRWDDITAGHQVILMYACQNNLTFQFKQRWLQMLPIRVG
jgi:Concanavalin A-like lectin/glucanases superfamily